MVLGRVAWSFVVRYYPRGMLVRYNVVKKDDIEEEDDVDEQDVVNVSNEELKEDEPNVLGDYAVLDDDVNEDMIKNDIDDDVDMINLFNAFSKPKDIDSR